MPATLRDIRFAAECGEPLYLTADEVRDIDAELERAVSAFEARIEKERPQ
jgi:hypothetical protein